MPGGGKPVSTGRNAEGHQRLVRQVVDHRSMFRLLGERDLPDIPGL